jgi:hypothetical protein
MQLEFHIPKGRPLTANFITSTPTSQYRVHILQAMQRRLSAEMRKRLNLFPTISIHGTTGQHLRHYTFR